MFSQFKIGTRLIAAFLVVSLMGAAVGAIGIRNMGVINDKASVLYQRELMGISYIKEANINLVYIGRAMGYMLLASTPEERARFNDRITGAVREMHRNADLARPLFVSEQGKAMFAKFDAELKAYDALVPDMLKRVETEALQDDSATVKYFFGTFRNRANAVDDMITELSKLKEQNAKAADDETNQIYADSRNFMILLVIGALGAGVALGVMASRSITRPLEQAVALAAKVAEGDLSSDISVHSKDEIGQLLQALSNMNGSLSRIVSDVRAGTQTIATASSQIASGSLDLSSRTEEQASSLEETASSMEELTSTVKQNADNARQARQLAESASQVAQKGGSVVAEVDEALLVEASASLRLWGGRKGLLARLLQETEPLAPVQWAQARTALSALGLLRLQLRGESRPALLPHDLPLDVGHSSHSWNSSLTCTTQPQLQVMQITWGAERGSLKCGEVISPDRGRCRAARHASRHLAWPADRLRPVPRRS